VQHWLFLVQVPDLAGYQLSRSLRYLQTRKPTDVVEPPTLVGLAHKPATEPDVGPQRNGPATAPPPEVHSAPPHPK
jgi:hypothetical protein